MFRNLRLPCAVAALVVSSFLPYLASAEVIHSRLKGPNAGASFHDYDPAACVFTLASFSINEMQFDDAPPSLWLSLYMDQYSLCGAGGSEYFAFEPLPEGAFRTDGGRLSSASLQVTIYAAYERGQPKIVPVVIDLVWTGEGDIRMGHTSQILSNRFFRTMTRSHGSSRMATVSGSMLLWGEELTDTESFAFLGFNHSGSITINKPR
jgi:hypothetical protein